MSGGTRTGQGCPPDQDIIDRCQSRSRGGVRARTPAAMAWRANSDPPRQRSPPGPGDRYHRALELFGRASCATTTALRRNLRSHAVIAHVVEDQRARRRSRPTARLRIRATQAADFDRTRKTCSLHASRSSAFRTLPIDAWHRTASSRFRHLREPWQAAAGRARTGTSVRITSAASLAAYTG